MKSVQIFTMSRFIYLIIIIGLLFLVITPTSATESKVVCCWEVCDDGDVVYILKNIGPDCKTSWFHGDTSLVDEDGGVDKEKVKTFEPLKTLLILRQNLSDVNFISDCHPANGGNQKVLHTDSCKYADHRCNKPDGLCEPQRPNNGVENSGSTHMFAVLAVLAVFAVFAVIAVIAVIAVLRHKKGCLRSHPNDVPPVTPSTNEANGVKLLLMEAFRK